MAEPNAVRSRNSRRAARSFLIVFVAFWSLLTGIFDAIIITGWVRNLNARSYTAAPAKVLESSVETSHSSDSTTYAPRILYEYSVAGKTYQSRTYRYGQWSTSDRGYAERIVAAHPVGRTLAAYYNPRDPADAVLTVTPDGLSRMLPLFLTPFNIVMLAGWTLLVLSLRARRDPGRVGGVRITEEVSAITVNLQSVPRPLAFFAGAMIVAFPGIFVAAFALGGQPSTTTLAVYWSLCTLSGVLALVWYAARVARGHYRLTIDPMRRTLTLPGLCKSPEPELSFARVRAVALRQSTTRHTNNYPNTDLFLVRAEQATPSPAPAEHRLRSFADPAEAEALASWLRERIGCA